MISKIKFIWLIYMFLGFSMSCEKTSDIQNGTGSDIDPKIFRLVIAGNADSSNYYLLFNPPEIIEEKEIGCLFFSGIDSLDIDNNGSMDLVIHSNTQVPDITGVCCNCPDDLEIICDCLPSGRTYKYIQVIDTMFQIAFDSNNKATCFELNDTIETWSKWISNNWITLIDHYSFPPPESINGYWTSSDDRYLGIRKIDFDTLYGWIKLNVSETIEIKELFFEMK